MNSLSLPLTSPLFDSHCHFDFDEFGGEDKRTKLWALCQKNNVKNLLIPGISPDQWARSDEISEAFTGVYMSVGVHPWWVSNSQNMLTESQLALMKSYLSKPNCLAVGECGLDAEITLPVTKQVAIFEQQVELAKRLEKPLIIHVRKTHNQTLQLLSRHRPSAGGVIHGFTGSIELAKQYWDLGFYLGVGGAITYPRAAKTRRTVQSVSLDSIVLETDAPDMPLYGYQGQVNSPLKIIEVAKMLAELRDISVEEVCQITTKNSMELFKI